MATATLTLAPVAGQRELQPSLCVSGASSFSSGSASCLTGTEAKGGDASPRSGGGSRGMGAVNLDPLGREDMEGLSASSDALVFLGADELPLGENCRAAPESPIGGPCSERKGDPLKDALLAEGYDDSSVNCQLSAAEKWADMLECGAEDILQFSYEDIAGPINQMTLPEPAIVSEAFPEEPAAAKESAGDLGEVLDWENLSLPDIYDFCAGPGVPSQAQGQQRIGCKRRPEEDFCGMVEDLALGPVPMRARSKRARAARKGWSHTVLVHLLQQPTRRRAGAGVHSKERMEDSIHAPTGSGASSGTVISCTNEGSAGQVDSPLVGRAGEEGEDGMGAPLNGSNKRGNPYTETGALRRCSHCSTAKTPQWRAGPNGPKTLCNACGVRYKSGRLCAEYRPASSPEFEADKHSNSHRKIVEMRKSRDLEWGDREGSGGRNGKVAVADTTPLPRPPVALKRSKKAAPQSRVHQAKVQTQGSNAGRCQEGEPLLPKREPRPEQEKVPVATPVKAEANDSAAPTSEGSPLSLLSSPGSSNMSCTKIEPPSSPSSPNSKPSAPDSPASIISVRILNSAQLHGPRVQGGCIQLGKQGGVGVGAGTTEMPWKDAVGAAASASAAASGPSTAGVKDILQGEVHELNPMASSAPASLTTSPSPSSSTGASLPDAPKAEGSSASGVTAAPTAPASVQAQAKETDAQLPKVEQSVASKVIPGAGPAAAAAPSGQKDQTAPPSACETSLTDSPQPQQAQARPQQPPQQQRPKPQKQQQVTQQQVEQKQQKQVLRIQPKPWHTQARHAGAHMVHHAQVNGLQGMTHTMGPQGMPMAYPPALPQVPFVQPPHYPSPPLQHLLHQQHMPVPAPQHRPPCRWPEGHPGQIQEQQGGSPVAQRTAGSPMRRKAGTQSPLPPAPIPATSAGSPGKAGPGPLGLTSAKAAGSVPQGGSPQRPGYSPGVPVGVLGPPRADSSTLEPAQNKGSPRAACGGGGEGEHGMDRGQGKQNGEQERLRGQLRKRQEMGQSIRRQMGTGPYSFSPSPSPPPVPSPPPAPLLAPAPVPVTPTPPVPVLSHATAPPPAHSLGSPEVRKEPEGTAETLPISVAFNQAPPGAPTAATPAV